MIEDLCDGLSNWMDEKGFKTIADVTGRSLGRVSEFKNLDLSFRAVARINAERCIKCNLCYIAITTAYQPGIHQGPANAIGPGKRPLSAMAPTIVLKGGKLFLALRR